MTDTDEQQDTSIATIFTATYVGSMGLWNAAIVLSFLCTLSASGSIQPSLQLVDFFLEIFYNFLFLLF